MHFVFVSLGLDSELPFTVDIVTSSSEGWRDIVDTEVRALRDLPLFLGGETEAQRGWDLRKEAAESGIQESGLQK